MRGSATGKGRARPSASRLGVRSGSRSSTLAVGLALLLVAAFGASACKGHESHPEGDAESSTTETSGADDGGPATVERIEAGVDAGPTGPQIAALDQTTPVFSMSEWPAKDPSKTSEERRDVVRLGYIRRGQVVAVKPNVIKKTNCPEGWYELVTGGFVCGKYATTDLNHKELATAPHPPFTDRPLPYEYGLNITNGAPLYRRRPLRKERKDLEKGLAVGKTKKKRKDDVEPASAGAGGDGETGDKPWYLKDHNGQRPQVKMDDLHSNEAGGLVVVRMVKGFYLALDKELNTQSGRFWRSTNGFLAPGDHILVHKPATEFEGVKIGAPGETRHIPLAWAVGTHANKYILEGTPEAPTKMKRGDHLDRFTIVQLTNKKLTFEGHGYFESSEGFWVRDADSAITRPGPPPKDLAPGEKWIDVNVSTQSLVAYEGDKAVYATIVSTGRHDDNDKAKDHRTVQGSFRIREKHIAATMEDDAASEGPYSIQDVPWIMYFEGSYALHGAFWHSMFGRERSHGCVNMTPHDAKQIFAWSGPTLPPGWHGAKATKDNPGTRVIVHADGPPPGSDAGAPPPSDAKKN